jgi:hypothetical protein
VSTEIEPVAPAPLTEAEARRLTDEIRDTGEQLGDLLSEAHDRRAWESLGYVNFAEYALAEFGMGKANAYKILAQETVSRELEEATGVSRARLPVSARQATELAPKLVNVVRAAKRAVKEHPDEPPEKVVGEVLKRAARPATKRQPKDESTPSLAELVARLPAPDLAMIDHLQALAEASPWDIVPANRADLRAARFVIDQALMYQKPPNPPVTDAVVNACAHPKNKLQNLGYAIKCGACGDVVKR